MSGATTPRSTRHARVIFQDFEPSNWSWDPVAKAYYWHRFYSHQPDLNFDNPALWEALLPVVEFWFAMGVDGMRLDAVPYLFEREGTDCENLDETHQFLKALRAYVQARFPDRMLLAEANQWPEDSVAYFGRGDECHMAFHFPLMPRLFMALHQEDRFPIHDIMDQTPLHPGNLPVVPVPAEPRRADAGDGDRRRTRLYVPSLYPGSHGAHQPGHPAPAGPALAQ